jgi:hypothetical protein
MAHIAHQPGPVCVEGGGGVIRWLVVGVVCQFAISPALCPPHMAQSPGVSTWAHGMELEPPEPPSQSGRYGPEKLSCPARATERRWGRAFAPPSRSRAEGQGGTAG